MFQHRQRKMDQHMQRHRHQCQSRNLTLTQGLTGEQLIVKGFAPGLCCAQRLRELGLTEGKIVVVLRAADPVLLALDDSRIALEHTVSDCIEVERVH